MIKKQYKNVILPFFLVLFVICVNTCYANPSWFQSALFGSNQVESFLKDSFGGAQFTEKFLGDTHISFVLDALKQNTEPKSIELKMYRNNNDEVGTTQIFDVEKVCKKNNHISCQIDLQHVSDLYRKVVIGILDGDKNPIRNKIEQIMPELDVSLDNNSLVLKNRHFSDINVTKISIDDKVEENSQNKIAPEGEFRLDLKSKLGHDKSHTFVEIAYQVGDEHNNGVINIVRIRGLLDKKLSTFIIGAVTLIVADYTLGNIYYYCFKPNGDDDDDNGDDSHHFNNWYNAGHPLHYELFHDDSVLSQGEVIGYINHINDFMVRFPIPIIDQEMHDRVEAWMQDNIQQLFNAGQLTRRQLRERILKIAIDVRAHIIDGLGQITKQLTQQIQNSPLLDADKKRLLERLSALQTQPRHTREERNFENIAVENIPPVGGELLNVRNTNENLRLNGRQLPYILGRGPDARLENAIVGIYTVLNEINAEFNRLVTAAIAAQQLAQAQVAARHVVPLIGNNQNNQPKYPAVLAQAVRNRPNGEISRLLSTSSGAVGHGFSNTRSSSRSPQEKH